MAPCGVLAVGIELAAVYARPLKFRTQESSIDLATVMRARNAAFVSLTRAASVHSGQLVRVGPRNPRNTVGGPCKSPPVSHLDPSAM